MRNSDPIIPLPLSLSIIYRLPRGDSVPDSKTRQSQWNLSPPAQYPRGTPAGQEPGNRVSASRSVATDNIKGLLHTSTSSPLSVGAVRKEVSSGGQQPPTWLRKLGLHPFTTRVSRVFCTRNHGQRARDCETLAVTLCNTQSPRIGSNCLRHWARSV